MATRRVKSNVDPDKTVKTVVFRDRSGAVRARIHVNAETDEEAESLARDRLRKIDDLDFWQRVTEGGNVEFDVLPRM